MVWLRWEQVVSLSARGRVELVAGVLKDGTQRWRPTAGLSHEDGARVAPLGRKVQIVKAVDDELQAPKSERFHQGRSHRRSGAHCRW
jgi:hypothetical protein